MVRKALVNDIVHSFCYAARRGEYEWPRVMLPGWRFPPFSTKRVPPEAQIVFLLYALRNSDNYIKALERGVLITSFLRDFSSEEQAYAVHLMAKYYDTRISIDQASSAHNQSDVRGNGGERLHEAAKLLEHNQLLNVGSAACVSA